MPKIVVCGKGGSGKSVLTVLLSRIFPDKGYQVLIIDSDESNLGLARMLGILPPGKSLLEYLGGKKEVGRKLRNALANKEESKIEMTMFSGDVNLDLIDPDCIVKDGNISLVQIGKILHAHEGCACPMGVIAREFLNKLSPGEKDMVIVDTEAGIEHFGRGLESGADVVLIVIDASYESVLLAEKVFTMSVEANVKCMAVINRVDETGTSIIKNALQKNNNQIAGEISYDPQIARACLTGEPVTAEGEAGKDVSLLVDFLENEVLITK